VKLPPLRERSEDIPVIAGEYVREFAQKYGKTVASIPAETQRLLVNYNWPGNVRELRNVVERATILADGQFIEPKHLPNALVAAGEKVQPKLALAPGTSVEEAERKLIEMTLEHTRQNKTRAAEILGISLKTLHNKLNKLKLRK
jgi:DNA-binding NtrC family response regulator